MHCSVAYLFSSGSEFGRISLSWCQMKTHDGDDSTCQDSGSASSSWRGPQDIGSKEVRYERHASDKEKKEVGKEKEEPLDPVMWLAISIQFQCCASGRV